MSHNLLAIDLGTSWAKVAVYSAEGRDLQLVDCSRLPSGIGAYSGTPSCLRLFGQLCQDLEETVARCVRDYAVRRIGLTGIREGLVLLDEEDRAQWVSGNAVLDGDELLDRWLGEIEVAPLLPELLARVGGAARLVTLQGYLAARLTGRYGITRSELSAFGLLAPRAPLSAEVERLLARTPLAAVGESLGGYHGAQEPDVYLAGTDEQASHYGAGVGEAADLGLATATFWSLTAPAGPTPPRAPELRYIPRVAPYPATVSIIGYRWGPYLQEALAGRAPQLPPRLPRWAIGRLLACLRGGTAPAPEALAAAAAADIKAALNLLTRTATVPADPVLAVHGGGLSGLRSFTCAVLQRVGCRWVEREGDATQLGCCLAGLG